MRVGNYMQNTLNYKKPVNLKLTDSSNTLVTTVIRTLKQSYFKVSKNVKIGIKCSIANPDSH